MLIDGRFIGLLAVFQCVRMIDDFDPRSCHMRRNFNWKKKIPYGWKQRLWRHSTSDRALSRFITEAIVMNFFSSSSSFELGHRVLSWTEERSSVLIFSASLVGLNLSIGFPIFGRILSFAIWIWIDSKRSIFWSAATSFIGRTDAAQRIRSSMFYLVLPFDSIRSCTGSRSHWIFIHLVPKTFSRIHHHARTLFHFEKRCSTSLDTEFLSTCDPLSTCHCHSKTSGTIDSRCDVRCASRSVRNVFVLSSS